MSFLERIHKVTGAQAYFIDAGQGYRRATSDEYRDTKAGYRLSSFHTVSDVNHWRMYSEGVAK